MSFLRKAGFTLTSALRATVMLLAVVTGVCILAMVLITCIDVVMRIFSRPIVGVYDLVYVFGAVAMACAIPYTTAVKGHVAIEYFFQKLDKKSRIIVDTFVRLLGIGLFSMLTHESARIGNNLKASGEVTATLQLPIFWVSWVIALCCALVVLVIFYNMTHPGKELVKP
ncbi:TRAP transporter small permease [candidate division KSB1 bacterium]|nr:TRAP transporter small permease [candidate division KSB1 bacterium]RQW00639.1 MAG: TRAP transporter small permease [candidate division KSB1 bacterium]